MLILEYYQKILKPINNESNMTEIWTFLFHFRQTLIKLNQQKDQNTIYDDLIKKFIYLTISKFYINIFDQKNPAFITHKIYVDFLTNNYLNISKNET